MGRATSLAVLATIGLSLQAQPAARSDPEIQSLLAYRSGLRATILYLDRTGITDERVSGAIPNPEVREALRRTWKTLLDYNLAIDSTVKAQADYLKLSAAKREKQFLIVHAGFLAKYRAALEFIEVVERRPEIARILNEDMPEIGLPAGSYSDFKFRYLNVLRASEFAAMDAQSGWIGGSKHPDLRRAVAEDRRMLLGAAVRKGPEQTLRNAGKIFTSAIWAPVPAGLATVGGGPSGPPPRPPMVSAGQIGTVSRLIQPGDIIFERREWAISNIGLPGFWPHVALYVGNRAQRKVFFDDPAVRSWVASMGQSADFESLLALSYPRAVSKAGTKPVLEALGEGVIFSRLEETLGADFVAVIRPRLTRAEIAQAIFRAFQYAGRPYDFEFDFVTDDAIVCTELIYKAYQPTETFRGIRFPVLDIIGRKTSPANDFVRYFDEQFGSPGRELDFVVFFDGHYHKKSATAATVEELRKSWQRPRWHVHVENE